MAGWSIEHTNLQLLLSVLQTTVADAKQGAPMSGRAENVADFIRTSPRAPELARLLVEMSEIVAEINPGLRIT